MRSKHVILHRAALALVALVAVAAFSGCSSVEPTDVWSEQTGRVTGTVRLESGSLLAEIEVCLWVEYGAEGLEVWYQTETDEYGAFEFDAVEMATEQSTETEYWIGANRTPVRSTSVDPYYTSCRSAITVPRNGTCTIHMVIDIDAGDPEAYIEE
jgi:hypothetical protein